MVPLPMNTFGGAPTIERVLCALDVEQPILSAVSLASLIASRFGATLEVLHAEGGAGLKELGAGPNCLSCGQDRSNGCRASDITHQHT